MSNRLLWRVDDMTTPTGIRATQLAAGLRVHLAHSSLTSVLMQVNQRQRAYLVLAGCAGCQYGRCEPGCPRDLLGRMLATIEPAAQLILVPSGLATRPYQRIVRAIPTDHAQLLDGTVLHAWADARLIMHWQAVGSNLSAGALLAVGRDSPDPATILREYGWRPVWWVRSKAAAQSQVPPALLRRGRWHGEPTILLPVEPPPPDSATTDPDHTAPATEQDGHALAARLAEHLAPLLDSAAADDELGRLCAPVLVERMVASALGESTSDDPSSDGAVDVAVLEPLAEQSIWPRGPGRMRPEDVGFLVEQIRTSPIVRVGAEPGITRKRIAQLLPDDLAEYSRQLMVWLDQAGLLSAPTVVAEPFRNPRMLIHADDDLLAIRLAATPLPLPEVARAAMHQS